MTGSSRKGRPKRTKAKQPVIDAALEAAAEDLLNKGISLGRLDKHEDAIAVYDEFIARFSDAQSPKIREMLAKAFINKGTRLGRTGHPVEEIAVYEELVLTFSKDSTPKIREIVATAILYTGMTLDDLHKGDAAVKAYDDLIKRFYLDQVPKVRERVAEALFNKGLTLDQLGKPDEAILAYSDLIGRFSQDQAPEIREQFAKALLNKGITLGQLNKPDEEILAYNDLIERLSQDQAPEIREQVAKALFNKGVTLGQLGKPYEELSAYNDLIDRFSRDQTPEIRERVAEALLNKGIRLGQLGKPDEAILAYDGLIDRFSQDTVPEICQIVGRTLLCMGTTLGELGENDAALKIYNEIISKFGPGGTDHQFNELCAHAFVSKAKLWKELDENADIEELLSHAVTLAGDSPQILSSYRLLSSHGKLVQRLENILAGFDSKTRDRFRERMKEQERRTNTFLEPKISFSPDRSLLFILREWNSFTPIIPDTHEIDRGGGYFIWHRGKGIVVDPGYDFIENFSRAGGRIHDIDCVVITHAHDDHTADFESVLTLTHQYNARAGKGRTKKKIDLFLSTGANRKLSGFFQLRGDERIGRLVVLNPCDRRHPQRVQLFEHSRLVVLPAYHDDVVTSDGSVGLAFELEMHDGTVRRVAFTGDSGLYPKRVDEEGKLVKYSDGTTALDIRDESKALYRAYQDLFCAIGGWETIDLLIPHLGSIKDYELDVPSYDPGKPLLYANHLGLHGLSILLDELRFKACIVSEFGEELKDLRLKLVEMLDEAVSVDREGNKRGVFLVPGDLTILYDIADGTFLCHETCDFEHASRLKAIERQGTDSSKCFRVFLFRTETASEGGCSDRERSEYIGKYYARLDHRDLPYFKK